MDSSDSWLLLGIAVCVLVAAIASAADAALTTISRHRLNAALSEGRTPAQAMSRLLDDPARLKATTLTLSITTCVVATALTVGIVMPWGQAWWQPVVGLGVLLLALLIFGEALPKAVATYHPARTARLLAPVLNTFASLLRPVSGLVNLVVRPIIRTTGNVLVSAEELKMLVHVGEEEGVIEHDEREMIEGILVFGDTLVREVMIPRVDIQGIPATATVRQAVDIALAGVHSRIPAYHETIDNLAGILYVRDLLPLIKNGAWERRIIDALRPVHYVPETMKVDALLRDLQARKVHMAAVVDEYGGTAGIVTIEDVLEEIVGDIQDEYDREEPTIRQLDATTWQADGRLSLDDLNDTTGLHLPTDEVDSLGGLFFEQSGAIPRVGDSVVVGDVRITVLTLQGLRPATLELHHIQAEPVGETVGGADDAD